MDLNAAQFGGKISDSSGNQPCFQVVQSVNDGGMTSEPNTHPDSAINPPSYSVCESGDHNTITEEPVISGENIENSMSNVIKDININNLSPNDSECNNLGQKAIKFNNQNLVMSKPSSGPPPVSKLQHDSRKSEDTLTAAKNNTGREAPTNCDEYMTAATADSFPAGERFEAREFSAKDKKASPEPDGEESSKRSPVASDFRRCPSLSATFDRGAWSPPKLENKSPEIKFANKEEDNCCVENDNVVTVNLGASVKTCKNYFVPVKSPEHLSAVTLENTSFGAMCLSPVLSEQGVKSRSHSPNSLQIKSRRKSLNDLSHKEEKEILINDTVHQEKRTHGVEDVPHPALSVISPFVHIETSPSPPPSFAQHIPVAIMSRTRPIDESDERISEDHNSNNYIQKSRHFMNNTLNQTHGSNLLVVSSSDDGDEELSIPCNVTVTKACSVKLIDINLHSPKSSCSRSNSPSPSGDGQISRHLKRDRDKNFRLSSTLDGSYVRDDNVPLKKAKCTNVSSDYDIQSFFNRSDDCSAFSVKNNFCSTNNTFGHAKGHALLRKVADLKNKALRDAMNNEIKMIEDESDDALLYPSNDNHKKHSLINAVETLIGGRSISRYAGSMSTVSSGSSGSIPSRCSSIGSSVTITKLSTGSILSIEPRDLKHLTPEDMFVNDKFPILSQRHEDSNGGVIIEDSSDQFKGDLLSLPDSPTQFHKHSSRKSSSSNQPQQRYSTCDIDSSIRCHKCREVFSTKEAMRLHTCNSILDQHFLIESGDRVRISPNSDSKSSNSTSETLTTSPVSSLSRSSSRSNSPVSLSNIAKKGTSRSPSNSGVKCKLIKALDGPKDELFIEGRPKLSVAKVSPATTTNPSSSNLSKTLTCLVPKLKLVNSSVSIDSSSTSQSISSVKPSKDSTSSEHDRSWKSRSELAAKESSVSSESPTCFTGKLKIKVSAGAFVATCEPPLPPSKNNENTSVSDDTGFPFTFAGRPTYSPSRIESTHSASNGIATTTTAVGHGTQKESPHDCSNKDSPASQADSGVFSIASSTSPSKADAAVSGTSPDSPNRGGSRLSFTDTAVSAPSSSLAAVRENNATQDEHQNKLQQQSFNQWKLGNCNSGVTTPVITSSKGATASENSSTSIEASSALTECSSSGPLEQISKQNTHIPSSSSSSSSSEINVLKSVSNSYCASYGNPMDNQSRNSSFHMNHTVPERSRLSLDPLMRPYKRTQPGPSVMHPHLSQAQSHYQYTYSVRRGMYGHQFDDDGGDVGYLPTKRKRGRPRKGGNSYRDIDTHPKRAYNRKKSSAFGIMPIPGGVEFMNSNQQNSQYHDIHPSVPARNMERGNCIYNFDEDDDSIQPMRPKRSTALQDKKYSFGSSSDEETSSFQPRKHIMQQQQHSLMAASHSYSYPQQPGMINSSIYHPNVAQQHRLGFSRVDHTQSLLQNQAKKLSPDDNATYSSEILTNETGTIGIKIKIKKPKKSPSKSIGQTNNTTAPNPTASSHLSDVKDTNQYRPEMNALKPTLSNVTSSNSNPTVTSYSDVNSKPPVIYSMPLSTVPSSSATLSSISSSSVATVQPTNSVLNKISSSFESSSNSRKVVGSNSHLSTEPVTDNDIHNSILDPTTGQLLPVSVRNETFTATQRHRSSNLGYVGGSNRIDSPRQSPQGYGLPSHAQSPQGYGTVHGQHMAKSIDQKHSRMMHQQMPYMNERFGNPSSMGMPLNSKPPVTMSSTGPQLGMNSPGEFQNTRINPHDSSMYSSGAAIQYQQRMMGPFNHMGQSSNASTGIGFYGGYAQQQQSMHVNNQLGYSPSMPPMRYHNNSQTQRYFPNQYSTNMYPPDQYISQSPSMYANNEMYGLMNQPQQQHSMQHHQHLQQKQHPMQQHAMQHCNSTPGGLSDMASPSFNTPIQSPSSHHHIQVPVGGRMISPIPMHQPMPGVGLPHVSPSIPPGGRITPLISPQSHNELSPSTTLSNYVTAPTTPQNVNPLTPISSHVSMPSPVVPPISSPAGPHVPSPLNQTKPSPMCYSHMPSPLPPHTPAAIPASSAVQSDVVSPPNIKSDPSPVAAAENHLSPSCGNLRNIRLPDKIKAEDVAAESPSRENAQNSPIPNKPVDEDEDEDDTEDFLESEPEVIPQSDFVARWVELPSKALTCILRHLTRLEHGCIPSLVRASLVSKAWSEAALEPRLWTHLNLTAGHVKERYRNDKIIESILKKSGQHVIEIKLIGWKNSVSTSTLRIMATYCPNLISLNLSGCFKLSNEDLKIIGDSFNFLKKIDLNNVSAGSATSRSIVSSTSLSDFIATVGTRLTHFNISNNKMSGLPFVFKALSAHSCNIEEVDISNITTTSRDTILINMEKFQKGCQKLRVLNANHTMISLTETPIKEQVHSPGFPELRELLIAVDSRGYFDGLDDSQMERVLKKSDKLRVLDIRGCQNISDSCLIRLPTWDIETLVLSGCSAASCSSDGFELMVRKWSKQLNDVDVSLIAGERVITNAIDAFVDADETHIRKLNFSGCSISVKSLLRLLKCCSRTLEYLNLLSCRNLPKALKRVYPSKAEIMNLKRSIIKGTYAKDDTDRRDE